MSIEVSKFYWDRCAGVKCSERLVILALADYCNESGWCFPSVPELARRCQLSDRGTQKILSRLAAGGHIAVEANQGRHKTRGSPTHKYPLLAYQRSWSGAKGEQLRSSFAAEKGEQIDRKGEPARSPEPYRSINDPNTSAAAAPPATPSDYQKVVAAYHNEIGTLTPIVEEEIKAELTRSAPDWVIRAIGIAAMRNHRRWAYVAGILRRWHADGYDGGPDKPGSKPGCKTGSKSMGYGRHQAPARCAKGQSIEDYADDPEYYGQLKALYAGGPAGAAAD
jgi:DnaD/phage-associated family protein